jgi:hypothetical protein
VFNRTLLLPDLVWIVDIPLLLTGGMSNEQSESYKEKVLETKVISLVFNFLLLFSTLSLFSGSGLDGKSVASINLGFGPLEPKLIPESTEELLFDLGLTGESPGLTGG